MSDKLTASERAALIAEAARVALEALRDAAQLEQDFQAKHPGPIAEGLYYAASQEKVICDRALASLPQAVDAQPASQAECATPREQLAEANARAEANAIIRAEALAPYRAERDRLERLLNEVAGQRDFERAGQQGAWLAAWDAEWRAQVAGREL